MITAPVTASQKEMEASEAEDIRNNKGRFSTPEKNMKDKLRGENEARVESGLQKRTPPAGLTTPKDAETTQSTLPTPRKIDTGSNDPIATTTRRTTNRL